MQNIFYITKTSYFRNAGCLFFCANFHCLFQKIVFSQISSKVHLEHRVRRILRSLRYLVISEFPTIPQEKHRLSFFHESSTNFTSIHIGESNRDISMLVSYSCNQFEVSDFLLLNGRIWKKMLKLFVAWNFRYAITKPQNARYQTNIAVVKCFIKMFTVATLTWLINSFQYITVSTSENIMSIVS